jgi:hypothetical protein
MADFSASPANLPLSLPVLRADPSSPGLVLAWPTALPPEQARRPPSLSASRWPSR